MGLHRKEGATLVGQPEGLGEGQRREARGWAVKDELLSYQEVVGQDEAGSQSKGSGVGKSPLSSCQGGTGLWEGGQPTLAHFWPERTVPFPPH